MNRRRVNKQSNELAVFAKCRDLITYTLNITNNTKRFPKKVRFTITNRIQDQVIDLYESLLVANEIYPRNESERYEREKMQRKALTQCKVLLFLIDLSFQRKFINERSCEYWTKLVLNVKYMTAKWMKVDKQRFRF